MVRPHFHPPSFFLVSSHSLNFFGGCLVWHLWLGRARHPGPGSGSVGIEVFNVGGWLTNGDFAVEAGVDFLCVTEHRLVSARARSEWKRLRSKSISSIWSPASQEFSAVVMLELVLSALKVLLWPCLLLLLLGLRGFLVLAELFVVWFLWVVADSCILLSCMVIVVLILLLRSFS